jgi:hypothetical protein
MATETECTNQANRLTAYWAKRGHSVRVEVVPMDDSGVTFTLKSDMVNGFPRTMAAAETDKTPTLTVRRLKAEEGGGLFHY